MLKKKLFEIFWQIYFLYFFRIFLFGNFGNFGKFWTEFSFFIKNKILNSEAPPKENATQFAIVPRAKKNLKISLSKPTVNFRIFDKLWYMWAIVYCGYEDIFFLTPRILTINSAKSRKNPTPRNNEKNLKSIAVLSWPVWSIWVPAAGRWPKIMLLLLNFYDFLFLNFIKNHAVSVDCKTREEEEET